MCRWLIPKVAEAGIDLLRIRRIGLYDYREGMNASWKSEKNANLNTWGGLFPHCLKGLYVVVKAIQRRVFPGGYRRFLSTKRNNKVKLCISFSFHEVPEMKFQLQFKLGLKKLYHKNIPLRLIFLIFMLMINILLVVCCLSGVAGHWVNGVSVSESGGKQLCDGVGGIPTWMF